ncbi:MFS transporter [Clostridium scatologenes]|uniref:Major facilitator superfamily MFS_1 n=1 Tax=Clostridium scatologenes TaxID=1548 RepID=A0A0E3M5R5_CLOSL|nr:MFS transporter [Clostridium scatologenes]AKA68769.1 major facilitator superfamily MFS_1 [Clostridium scatologenes]
METSTKKIPGARWIYILPVCFITTFFYFIDRQIISIALPGGLQNGLALNSTMAGLVAGVFSIGVLFLSVPAGQLAQKGKVKKFVSICIAGWSIFTILTGFVQTGWQLVAVRFVIGFFEGAFSPAITTIFTFWFPDKDGERNRANSTYFTAISIAAVSMGPIGGTLIQFYGWRSLFIILGLLSLVGCALWHFFIFDRPEQAKWLSKEEREYIEATIQQEREEAKKVAGNVEVKSEKLPLGLLLRNKYVWSLCIVGFTVNIGQFGYTIWMPTMIKAITKTNILNVGFISIIPNIFTVIGLWAWTYIATKVKNRRLTTGLPLVMFAVSLLIANFAGGTLTPVAEIALLCLVSIFVQGHMPSYYSIPSLVLVKELDGPARGMMAVAMGLGSFVGPYAVGYFITLTGSSKAGMFFLTAMLIIGGLSTLLLPKNMIANTSASK